jgi:hypothetical protein
MMTERGKKSSKDQQMNMILKDLLKTHTTGFDFRRQRYNNSQHYSSKTGHPKLSPLAQTLPSFKNEKLP